MVSVERVGVGTAAMLRLSSGAWRREAVEAFINAQSGPAHLPRWRLKVCR